MRTETYENKKNGLLNGIYPAIIKLNNNEDPDTFFAPDEICESVAVYNSLVSTGMARTYRSNVADMFAEYGFKTDIINGMWEITIE